MNPSLIKHLLILAAFFMICSCKFYSKNETISQDVQKDSVIQTPIDTIKYNSVDSVITAKNVKIEKKESVQPPKNESQESNVARSKPVIQDITADEKELKIVSVNKRGTLSSNFTKEELIQITKLKITGEVNTSDLMFINPNMPNLVFLDLKGCNIDVKKIPDNFFYTTQGVTKLQTFIFPGNLEAIGRNAFALCSNLKGNLIIPESVTNIDNGAFYICSGLSGALVLPPRLKNIGDWAFFKCSGLSGTLNIPESVNNIGENAFSYCSGFTGSLSIPKGIKSINFSTFSYCNGFDGKLLLPESVIEIKKQSFFQCSGLTGELILPLSVRYIGMFAFNGCSGFTGKLLIPDSVNEIGMKAFYNCTGLSLIKISRPVPVVYNPQMFPDGVKIEIPKSVVSDYEVSSGWKDQTIIGY